MTSFQIGTALEAILAVVAFLVISNKRSKEMKDYLGDGVYVYDEGFQIKLETDGNEIYLDDSVVQSLFAFLERSRGLIIAVKRNEGATK